MVPELIAGTIAERPPEGPVGSVAPPGPVEGRIPVGTAAVGAHVEDGPERVDLGRAAGVLAGVALGHLAGPEVAEPVAVLAEHVLARDVGVVGVDPVAGVVARDVAVDRQVRHPELPLGLDQSREGGAGGEGDSHVGLDRRDAQGERLHEARAHGAGVLALGPEHIAVDPERVVSAEEVGQGDLALLALEAVVLGQQRSGRERAALGGDALGQAAQLVFADEQALARGAVVIGLAELADRVAGGERLGGL